jgi:hypothetical protein
VKGLATLDSINPSEAGEIDQRYLRAKQGKINAARKDAGRGSTVASLHVKAAKVVVLRPILQIVQIEKSTSYAESVG